LWRSSVVLRLAAKCLANFGKQPHQIHMRLIKASLIGAMLPRVGAPTVCSDSTLTLIAH
jgi:hypothetical protein